MVAALQSTPRVTSERMNNALATIAHRGPDNMGWWFSSDRQMGLGHARLSIIGLKEGNQPIANAAGDVRCVVNGEFYGYQTIRSALRAEGYHFTTDSDSEIALHLYMKLGAECVHQLRGEFAMVIADERRRRLFAVRDRFGIKPLFYAVHEGSVYFASEIKALLALGVPARWDRDAFFAECHSVRCADRTLFAGIFAVPPGCLAIARDGRVEIRRYWDIKYPSRATLAADPRSERDIVNGFRAVLEDAVAQRLVADVEVACYLSGGIDSCAVLGLAQRQMSRPIRAFSIVFDDPIYDERHLAQQATQVTGAELVPVPVRQAQLADAFADALWHSETLLLNGHGVAKYLLSRVVRDAGIKVVLTGEGADEILAGYPPFRHDMILHNSDGQDPAESQRLIVELAAANQSSRGLLSADGTSAPGLEVFNARLGWIPSSIEAFSTLATKMYPLFYDHYRLSGLRANPYAELLDGFDVRNRLAGRDPVNQALYLWTHLQLPNYVLTVLADRVEMAHSVEGRVPFLDHFVAEYASGLPVHYKIRGMREKYVLREAVRDCVPPDVYNRQKHPFMTPPARSDDDPLSIYCQDLLRSNAVDKQPFFEPKRVRTLMDRIASLPPDDRAAFEGVVLRVASTCVLQERFALSA
ncbi:MAG TPA: asparagine synthase (glutamine-hydrolyzing) [Azospirillum sp.]|nr:asparagine synthase (glutamine-hydrolyzing) [Azospirillum sp.]